MKLIDYIASISVSQKREAFNFQNTILCVYSHSYKHHLDSYAVLLETECPNKTDILSNFILKLS